MEWSTLTSPVDSEEIEKCWESLISKKEATTPFDTAIATKETNLEFVLSITKLYILMIHTVKCSNNTKCCCKHWKSLEPSSRTRIGKFIRHLSTCKKQKCSVKHCSLMKFFFHHRNACHCSSCKFCNQFVNCLTFHSNTSEKSAQP